MDYTNEDKIRFLKSYMGEYFGKVEKKKYSKYDKLKDLYIKELDTKVKELIGYFLIRFGYIRYKVRTTVELIDNFLSNDIDKEDLSLVDVLFIVHFKESYPNKGLNDICREIISTRRFHKKITIFITNEDIVDIKSMFISKERKSNGHIL